MWDVFDVVVEDLVKVWEIVEYVWYLVIGCFLLVFFKLCYFSLEIFCLVMEVIVDKEFVWMWWGDKFLEIIIVLVFFLGLLGIVMGLICIFNNFNIGGGGFSVEVI